MSEPCEVTYDEAARSRDRILIETTGSAGLPGYFRQIAVQAPRPTQDDVPNDVVNILIFTLSYFIQWVMGTVLGFGLLGLVDMCFWYAVSWLGVAIGHWVWSEID